MGERCSKINEIANYTGEKIILGKGHHSTVYTTPECPDYAVKELNPNESCAKLEKEYKIIKKIYEAWASRGTKAKYIEVMQAFGYMQEPASGKCYMLVSRIKNIIKNQTMEPRFRKAESRDLTQSNLKTDEIAPGTTYFTDVGLKDLIKMFGEAQLEAACEEFGELVGTIQYKCEYNAADFQVMITNDGAQYKIALIDCGEYDSIKLSKNAAGMYPWNIDICARVFVRQSIPFLPNKEMPNEHKKMKNAFIKGYLKIAHETGKQEAAQIILEEADRLLIKMSS